MPISCIYPIYFKNAFSHLEGGYSSCGKGCYFAVEAKYSVNDNYCTANEQHERFIFLVSVVTGEYCEVKEKDAEKLTMPPEIPNKSGMRYDSVINDARSSLPRKSMFAVFDDNAACPIYLIRFRLVCDPV